MIGQTITFDGHRLNDLFFVGAVDVGLPEFSARTEDRTTADGAVFRSNRLGSVRIAMELVVKPTSGRTSREALSKLLSWLDVDEPRVLTLSEDEGLARLAVPTGTPTVADSDYNDRLTVEFLQPDPALWGTTRTITVPSTGSVTFVVSGDYPTRPSVHAALAVRSPSTEQWGLRLDRGRSDMQQMSVPLAGSSGHAVDFDCEARTCHVDLATTVPSLASDWFVLAPGTHSIDNNNGTHNLCELTWTERWHR